MYAIIETGGKQYKVEKDDVIDVELLNTEDTKVNFENVLFFSDGKDCQVGLPHIEKCTVIAERIGDVKGPKVIAFKYKRRKNFRKKKGHRQNYSRFKIIDIKLG